MVILLLIVFLQLKLAVMQQRDHFVCLYLKTWRVGFLLFPSPIPFKFQNFVNSSPAQFQQVLQKIIGCRTVLHIEFFSLKKSSMYMNDIVRNQLQLLKNFIINSMPTDFEVDLMSMQILTWHGQVYDHHEVVYTGLSSVWCFRF